MKSPGMPTSKSSFSDCVQSKPTSVIQCLRFDERKRRASFIKLIYGVLASPRRRLLVLFRLAQYVQHRRIIRSVVMILYRRAQLRLGCEVHVAACIGPRLYLPHPNGIVIGKGAVIGADVCLFQQVTIGARARGDSTDESGYPQIGDRTEIYAGAKIIGPVKIGSNCKVGANAVVTRDVPDNCTAVGIPARILAPSAKEVSGVSAIGNKESAYIENLD